VSEFCPTAGLSRPSRRSGHRPGLGQPRPPL